jgi:hypothetical protein
MTGEEPLVPAVDAAARTAAAAAELSRRMLREHETDGAKQPWPPAGTPGQQRELLTLITGTAASLQDAVGQLAAEPTLDGGTSAVLREAYSHLVAFGSAAGRADRGYDNAAAGLGSHEPLAREAAFSAALAMFGRLLDAPDNVFTSATRAVMMSRLAGEARSYQLYLPHLARDLGIGPGHPDAGGWTRMERAVGLIADGFSEMAGAAADISGAAAAGLAAADAEAEGRDPAQAFAGKTLPAAARLLEWAEKDMHWVRRDLSSGLDRARGEGIPRDEALAMVTSRATPGPLGRRYLAEQAGAWDVPRDPDPGLLAGARAFEEQSPAGLASIGARLAAAERSLDSALARFGDARDFARAAGVPLEIARELVTGDADLGPLGRDHAEAGFASWDSLSPLDLADAMADGTEPATFWDAARHARAAKATGDYEAAARAWGLASRLLPAGDPLRDGLVRTITSLGAARPADGYVDLHGRLLTSQAAARAAHNAAVPSPVAGGAAPPAAGTGSAGAVAVGPGDDASLRVTGEREGLDRLAGTHPARLDLGVQALQAVAFPQVSAPRRPHLTSVLATLRSKVKQASRARRTR